MISGTALSGRRKLAILWSLYFVQGMPYGFQITALPVYLRDSGMSLTGIGLAAWLSVPWLLKFLWAPLVDRYGGGRLGRRRSWILPLQYAFALTCALAAFVSPERSLTPLLVLVLAMNLFAATLDIAVDGLAIDLLEPQELGRGNIAQVVGFKAGMLTGGGLLVWASQKIGWGGLFLSMALFVVVASGLVLGYREAPAERGSSGSVVAVLKSLGRALSDRTALWLLLFVVTYKCGESMADTMFRPFLVDAGFTAGQIGLWVGTWGMLFSLAGSFFGGTLASRIPLFSALVITAILRVLPIAGEWWLTLTKPTAAAAVSVTCAEQFFGGALTTATFAYMMSRVDRSIGASHFTLLAAVEVGGKLLAGSASGAITDATSYPFLFGLATVLSLVFLLFLVPLRRLGDPRSPSTDRLNPPAARRRGPS